MTIQVKIGESFGGGREKRKARSAKIRGEASTISFALGTPPKKAQSTSHRDIPTSPTKKECKQLKGKNATKGDASEKIGKR